MNISDHAGLAGFIDNDGLDYDEHNEVHKAARNLAKKFVFGWLYGQGDTIRGTILWFDEALKDGYTDTEYFSAKEKIEKRLTKLGDKVVFPLRKGQFVEYTELLILQTIYGKRVADTFLKRVTGIKDLIKSCQGQAKKGYVTGIDGRQYKARSTHSALNLLLQGSAGTIAKQWCVNYHKKAKEYGLIEGKDFYQMAFVHDEYQDACVESKADILGKAMVDGCAMIQKQLSVNLPIEADYQVGNSWAETH